MLGSKIVLKRRTRVRHLPMRVASGAYILNSGLGKLGADEETTKRLHHFAAEVYPQVADMDAESFVKSLGRAEIALGSALVLPIVPSWLAGAGLAAFAGGLVNLYLRTPGLHKDGSVLPNADGQAMAKDVWLLGIALALLLDRESWFRRRH
jgi:hypothetical protein